MCSRLLVPSVLLLALVAAARAGDDPLSIPFTRHVLDNGLTLVVHEDHEAPIVAVTVWYHVGSKDEGPGETGFAHLVEHLMFQGGENHDQDHLLALERVGATDVNGSTNPDRTSYFQTVPVEALDAVLWLESDRMGNLLGAVGPAELDEQRAVVEIEVRRDEARPDGRFQRLIAEGTYPPDHPYSRSPMGSARDLASADLGDLTDWFERYYGAANAVIVLAGDIDPGTAIEKVEHYFGWIPAGPPVSRHREWIAASPGIRRYRAEARVSRARVSKTWNVPPIGDPDLEALNLLSDVLARGKGSRLHERLVHGDGPASEVEAYVIPREIGSQFRIRATARPGADLSTVERAIDRELERLLRDGPTEHEVSRVKTRYRADVARLEERLGGLAGKSDLLARCEGYFGNPGCLDAELLRVAEADPSQLQKAGRVWLSSGEFVLEVHPFPEYRWTREAVDRSRIPYPSEIAVAPLPAIRGATLANGLEVLVVERPGAARTRLRLLVEAGLAADGESPGLASFAWEMLLEGAGGRSGPELADALADLGADLTTEVDLDLSTIDLVTLSDTLDGAIGLLTEMIQDPAVPPDAVERIRAERLAAIERERMAPHDAALRSLPSLLFPEGHAYRTPLTGTGTSSSVAAIRRQDLVEFHRTWVRPNHSTLVVVGDTTLEELRTKLERTLGSWRAGDTPARDRGEVLPPDGARAHVIDRPGTGRAIVFAAQLVPPPNGSDVLAFETLDLVLGGTYSSRIDRNLREEKRWAQDARTRLVDARGPRLYYVYASVDADRTSEAMREILTELRGLAATNGVTSGELERARDRQTLRLAGLLETSYGVTEAITSRIRSGLPAGSLSRLPAALRALATEDLDRLAERVLLPDRLLWIIVGDAETILPEVRDLGLGDIRLLEPD